MPLVECDFDQKLTDIRKLFLGHQLKALLMLITMAQSPFSYLTHSHNGVPFNYCGAYFALQVLTAEVTHGIIDSCSFSVRNTNADVPLLRTSLAELSNALIGM